nr:MAG TPA: hypothetical protein [Caudoviricetes sp.]
MSRLTRKPSTSASLKSFALPMMSIILVTSR